MKNKNVKVELNSSELEYLIGLVIEDYDRAYATASLEIDKKNEDSNLINQLDRYAIFVSALRDKLKSYEV